MREIKFRAKHIKTGQWWYGSSEVTYHGYKQYRVYALTEFWGYVRKGILDTETVGQYTGLKDKNGKEIYEGDIVQYNHSTAVYGLPLKYKGAVEWFDGYTLEGNNAKFHINNRFDIGQDIIWPEIEVIGTIYENPELMEAKK